jgi:putative hydrolase of the HAD superfamily
MGGGYRDAEIDTIICDVGGVVILFSPDRSAEIERRHGIPPGDLLNVVLKSPPSRLASVGRLDHDTWFRQVAATVGQPAVEDWLAYHGELNLPVVEILTTARGNGIRVLLLSNATTRLWDDLDHHGIRDLADQVFCSADIGFAKPDAGAYELVVKAASVVADRTLYVDDTASWVEAGQALGMQGYVYGTPDGLRRELVALGVSV